MKTEIATGEGPRRPWNYAAGGLFLGLIAGVSIGMVIGLQWAKDHAAWVAAIGTVVAAVGTIVAAIYAVRAFHQQVGRLRAENKARDDARSDAEFKDAQNVIIECRPHTGYPESDHRHMTKIHVKWTIGSTVPAMNVRLRAKPFGVGWHGIRDAIPAGASGTAGPFPTREPYKIPDVPDHVQLFMYQAEVRYTLAGQRWSRTGFQDPVRVNGPDPDE